MVGRGQGSEVRGQGASVRQPIKCVVDQSRLADRGRDDDGRWAVDALDRRQRAVGDERDVLNVDAAGASISCCICLADRFDVALAFGRQLARPVAAIATAPALAAVRRPTSTRCASSSPGRPARAPSGTRGRRSARSGRPPSAARRASADNPCGRNTPGRPARAETASARPWPRRENASAETRLPAPVPIGPTSTNVAWFGRYIASSLGANTMSQPRPPSSARSRSRSRG